MPNNWFQTKDCLEFYNTLSFIEPFSFTVDRNGVEVGRIVGYIQKDGGRIKQYFSRRAIIIGGPMLAEDISDIELSDLLSSCYEGLKSKAIYIETRNFDDYSKFKETFENNGFNYEPHFDVKINCSDWSETEANIGKHRKKYIRLSLRDGANIVSNPTIEQLKDFYSILQSLYQTKVRRPLWPYEFFEKLYYSTFCKYILIEYNSKIIGGSVCIIDQDQRVYEWFACGKDGEYKNIHPSSLVKYYGMKLTCDSSCKIFDMMGAGAPNDGGYGVRDFKLEFGGELLELGRFKCIINRPLFLIGKIGLKILRLFK